MSCEVVVNRYFCMQRVNGGCYCWFVNWRVEGEWKEERKESKREKRAKGLL
jgi:hypothetical protein